MPEWTEVAGIVIGFGGLALAVAAFVIGFKRHDEAKKNHKEAMARQDDNAKAEDNRHEEAMANHREAMARQDDNRRALEAIIRNTAPRPGPAE